MSSKDRFEKLSAHADRLWEAIDEVAKVDRALADKLQAEYKGVLQGLLEILDEWTKKIVY